MALLIENNRESLEYIDETAYNSDALEEFLKKLTAFMAVKKEDLVDREILQEINNCQSSETSLILHYREFVLECAKSMMSKGCSKDEVTLFVRNLSQSIDERSDQLQNLGYAPQANKSIKVEAETQSISPALPKHAPALWSESKEPGETPPAFIQRHYAPWLGKGISRADIRRIDPKLYMALGNWLRQNTLPEDFGLPTLAERNDEKLKAFSGGTCNVSAAALDPSQAKETFRLASALNYRSQKRDR